MNKYQNLYETLKKAILQGQYTYHQKIPSIREMALQTSYSRTTIEAAYNQLLVEGYIVSVNKVGYFVDVDLKEQKETITLKKDMKQEKEIKYDYDFTGQAVDPKSFDMNVWKRYLKWTLNREKDLFAYGDNQGEYHLRLALLRYGRFYRGIQTEVENVIIGSGFQSLLTLLCGLCQDKKYIGIPESGFIYAQTIFEDFNKHVVLLKEDEEGVKMDELKKYPIDLLYLNPSMSGKQAKPLSISRRLEIIAYANKKGIYLIEDDHNGELRYLAKPVPAMQSQDTKHIIYIGSFSKLLIPSLRFAYMVLPDDLKEAYLKKKTLYHQNVSMIDQLTLAKYIEEGQLIRQLKKCRRLYDKKSRILFKKLKSCPYYKEIILEETSLRYRVYLSKKINPDDFSDYCIKHQVGVLVLDESTLLLSFSSIPIEKIEAGLDLIEEYLKTVR